MPEGFAPGVEPLVVEELEKQITDEIEHRWLYSMVPVTGASHSTWSGDRYDIHFPIVAALTGYCKYCGKAFSQTIPVDTLSGKYTETILNVERRGCTGGF